MPTLIRIVHGNAMIPAAAPEASRPFVSGIV